MPELIVQSAALIGGIALVTTTRKDTVVTVVYLVRLAALALLATVTGGRL